MKRILITLLAALPLTFGVAAAGADTPSWDGPGESSVVPVVGTVVSTDAAAGSFVANVVVPTRGDDGPGDGGGDGGNGFGGGGGGGGGGGDGGGGGGGGGDNGGDGGGQFNADDVSATPTQVTITTDSNTRIRVNDQPGSVGDMTAGDRFVALFNGSRNDSLDTLVSSPALAVLDHAAPAPDQLYAFVGTVTAVDTTAGTVTVDVSRSLPGDLAPAGSPPVPFTVSADTLILGGSSGGGLFGGSLGGVSIGDVVAGGLVASAGETLDQVETTPLRLLLDLPVPSRGSGGVNPTSVKASALKRALALLGLKSTKSHSHKKSHHRHGRKHKHAHRHAKKHARRG